MKRALVVRARAILPSLAAGALALGVAGSLRLVLLESGAAGRPGSDPGRPAAGRLQAPALDLARSSDDRDGRARPGRPGEPGSSGPGALAPEGEAASVPGVPAGTDLGGAPERAPGHARPDSLARRTAAATSEPAPPETAAEHERAVAAVLEDLHDPNPRHRILALVQARDRDLPEVMPEVRRAALEDADPVARRFAVQALALDADFRSHEDVFLQLAEPPDWTIRANASLGLARLGDENAQADLLALLERLEAEGSTTAGGVARAVESPDLHGARLLEHYRRRANDQGLSEEERRDAATILAAKQAAVAASSGR